MLLLLIGDFHVPYRSSGIPTEFRDFLTAGRIQHVLCTGNLCSETYLEFLQEICRDVHIVQGDQYCLNNSKQFPEEKVLNFTTESKPLKVGILHGHQILPWGDYLALKHAQRRLNVDILVTGHTHECKCDIVEEESEQGGGDHAIKHLRLLINPGSATGAMNHDGVEYPPSFIVLDIQGELVIVYIYKLVCKDGKNEVSIERIEFSR
ncbi:hypothetical protein GJ496_002907 [Pomphorhynchus laevis]|nr:hypothetical protein GJ496_002907 [Pomphorhynchus laevis]